MCFKLNSLEVFAQDLQAFLNTANWDPLLGNRHSDGLVCFSCGNQRYSWNQGWHWRRDILVALNGLWILL